MRGLGHAVKLWLRHLELGKSRFLNKFKMRCEASLDVLFAEDFGPCILPESWQVKESM